jgi:hypothetical protein
MKNLTEMTQEEARHIAAEAVSSYLKVTDPTDISDDNVSDTVAELLDSHGYGEVKTFSEHLVSKDIADAVWSLLWQGAIPTRYGTQFRLQDDPRWNFVEQKDRAYLETIVAAFLKGERL